MSADELKSKMEVLSVELAELCSQVAMNKGLCEWWIEREDTLTTAIQIATSTREFSEKEQTEMVIKWLGSQVFGSAMVKYVKLVKTAMDKTENSPLSKLVIH